VRINFNNSRNVSIEKIKTLDDKNNFGKKNSIDGGMVGLGETYDMQDQNPPITGKVRPTKTSRKCIRRGTTNEKKHCAKINNFQYQVSPMASNWNMANVNFQEGANISQIGKSQKKSSNRMTTRRNLNNMNASMLSGEVPDILSESRRRHANETTAPNVVIYQKFKVSLANKKKKGRGRVNQSLGLKEMVRFRKRSMRDSIKPKRSPKNKIFSSIRSGSIAGKKLF